MDVHYSLRCPYKILAGRLGPHITLRLVASNGAQCRAIGLLDSGAHRCVLSVSYATALGIKWEDGPPSTLMGINGIIACREHQIGIQIAPLTTPVRCIVDFCPTLPQGFVLVGRAGVFEALQIGFNEHQREFYLAALT